MTGRVAAEDAVPNAVKSAPPMLPMNRNGKLRVAMAKLEQIYRRIILYLKPVKNSHIMMGRVSPPWMKSPMRTVAK